MLYAARGSKWRAIPGDMLVLCRYCSPGQAVQSVSNLLCSALPLCLLHERRAINYICGTFPCILTADHERAVDVWASNDIESPAVVSVLFPVQSLVRSFRSSDSQKLSLLQDREKREDYLLCC